MSPDTPPAPHRYGLTLIQVFAGVAIVALIVIGYGVMVKLLESTQTLVIWCGVSALFMAWVAWTLYRGQAKQHEWMLGLVIGMIVVGILAAIWFPLVQRQRHLEYLHRWKLAHPGQRWPYVD